MNRVATLVLIAGVVAGLAFWIARLKDGGDSGVALEPVPVAEPVPAPPEPDPVAEVPPPPAPPPAPRAPPLPPLDASDGEVLGVLRARAEPGLIERLLVVDGLLRKAVATVDNLARANVSMNVRAVPPVPQRFLVAGEGDQLYLDEANYARYRQHLRLLETLSPQAAAELYARYYPLLQEAYTELGYPDAAFHGRVLEVVDQLLATPVVRDPIRLTRPHVLYEFADPDLEALSAGQKMLLRSGPGHTVRAQAWLREFRAALAAAEQR